MQQQEPHSELFEQYRFRVHQSFVRARICVVWARTMRKRGDTHQFNEWMSAARILRRAAAEWRKRAQRIAALMVLSVLAVGLAVLAIAKIAIAYGPGTSRHIGGGGCANYQPGDIDPRGTPCLTTPVPPTTTLPATILKLHCGEDGIIRRCDDED